MLDYASPVGGHPMTYHALSVTYAIAYYEYKTNTVERRPPSNCYESDLPIDNVYNTIGSVPKLEPFILYQANRVAFYKHFSLVPFGKNIPQVPSSNNVTRCLYYVHYVLQKALPSTTVCLDPGTPVATSGDKRMIVGCDTTLTHAPTPQVWSGMQVSPYIRVDDDATDFSPRYHQTILYVKLVYKCKHDHVQLMRGNYNGIDPTIHLQPKGYFTQVHTNANYSHLRHWDLIYFKENQCHNSPVARGFNVGLVNQQHY